MTYEFIISNSKDKKLSYSIDLDNDYSLQYSNENYLSDITHENKRLICFGYVFDIRNPEESTEKTLTNLLVEDTYTSDCAYLNGQYILILIKDERILITADATSLVPVYINQNLNEISNIPNNNTQYKIFNSNLIFNIINKSRERISFNLECDNVNDEIITYVKNQHRYFYNKNIHLEFKSNNFMKTLISIMKPVLYNNVISISDSNNTSTDMIFAQSISKDFNMEFTDHEVENTFYLRNQLFDFKFFMEKRNNQDESVLKDDSFETLNDKRRTTESNILTRKRNQSKELSKKGLLYDPFNSHVIIQTLLHNDEIKNNLTNIITKELLPSINYYDFSSSSLLKEKNEELVNEIELLKKRQITAHNEQFLLNTKMSYFNVTENLDGKVKNNEILVYPATQNIKPQDKYVIYYENPIEGLILVKSFFSNKKNGQTISVIIDDKHYTVDELFKGILINVEHRLKITMQYKKARNSLPWQKAGMLLIKQK